MSASPSADPPSLTAARFLVCLLVAACAGSVAASEEESLPWSELRIVGPEREDTGRVVFVAEARDGGWRVARIEAFGRRFSLDREQQARLAGFPLSSVETTHEVGYELLGGHTVYFKFDKLEWRDDRLIRSEVVISISRGRGLRVDGPKQRVVRSKE